MRPDYTTRRVAVGALALASLLALILVLTAMGVR
jgi:hypothetical protein